jgi:hypothetical protein
VKYAPLFPPYLARSQEPLPKQKFEWKRLRWQRSFFNSIEYQFGGAAEAEKARYGLPYEPTCLDDMFAGSSVNMQRLEALFDMHRKRLAEALQNVQKRRYDHLAVVAIMGFLLKKPRKKRKKSRPGRPRKPWLDSLDLRTRVLSGIEARINGIAELLSSIVMEEFDLSKLTDRELALAGTVFEHFRGYAEWHEKIADPLLAVVHRHLSNSGKK